VNNLYHRLAIPSWLSDYFGLPAIDGAELGLAAGVLWPRCTTLPMGWTHSIFLATTVLKAVLQPVLQTRSRDILDGDHSLTEPRYGVYVDDFFLFDTDKARANGLHFAVVDRLNTVGLLVRPAKDFAATGDTLTVQGISIYRDGTVVPDASKSRRLLASTRDILQRGITRPKHLSRLLGQSTWMMLLRRPLLSIFRAVYYASTRRCARPLVLRQFIRDELHRPLLICSRYSPHG